MKILNRLGDLAAAVQRLQDALNELQGHLEAAVTDDDDATGDEVEAKETATITVTSGDAADVEEAEESADDEDTVEDVEYLRAYA